MKELNARKRKKLKRQKSSSRLQKENSEKFEVPSAKRSPCRRKQETLEACGELHGALKMIKVLPLMACGSPS